MSRSSELSNAPASEAWQGPTLVRSFEEGTHWELRIAELPDFFLATETAEELLDELKPALRAFLESYLERGEEPPLPPKASLMWRVSVTPNRDPFEVTSASGAKVRLEVA